MRMMDVFVLPSLAEGISNTILEAMASGLPVVATRVGGNAELVTDGMTGMLVPPDSPTRIAEAIASYYADPEMAARHGSAARKGIETGFSMKAMTEGYLQVYDKVLD
jgi:glycosyltransferase involved in cell wall biosynthesis